MRWFFPQYNGDFRLIEIDTYRDHACALEIVDPTAHELTLLDDFLVAASKKKWTPISKVVTKEIDGKQRQDILLAAPLPEVGRLLYSRLRPGDRTITAVKSASGVVQVFEAADLSKVDTALDPDAVIPTPESEPDSDSADPEPEEPADRSEALAVSTKRPTPSCPQCVPGATDRASEVLLSFLSPLEHELWARERFIVVEGGLSGHRYMLAHRHSHYAVKCGRICYDLDDDVVVHFHDNSVPPEEEVLAAKLILEHREPWLRNEATLFHAPSHVERYKNPFGGLLDGTTEASQTQSIGRIIKTLIG
jgi:hypothetical protein